MKRKGKNKELLIHLSTSIVLEVMTFIELWKMQGSGVEKRCVMQVKNKTLVKALR